MKKDVKMNREVILCKYGEIILKGQNRRNFESMLVKELRRRACPHGLFKIYFNQSTIYVEPQNDECDLDGMFASVKKLCMYFCSGPILIPYGAQQTL